MPDTDSYDPSAGNEQLDEARQKTADQAKVQEAQNQAGTKSGGAKPSTQKNPVDKAVASNPVESGLKSLSTKTLGILEKGGTIHKTGPYTLHAGEEVLPKTRASEYRKVFKARGQAGKHKWGK